MLPLLHIVYRFYNIITCIYDRSKELLLSNSKDNVIDYVLSVVNSVQHNNGMNTWKLHFQVYMNNCPFTNR